VYFEIALMSTITGYLGNYANASFSTSQLLSVSSVMSSIIGGVLRLPTAKIIDIWGRAEGFFIMMCICIIGLIIFAASNNVQTYAAASVIYYIGYDGMYYVMTVFIADTTRLKHRILMLAISQTPFICTAFTTPYAVASFVNGAGWRWGYGTFAIVTPVACLPLCGVFYYYQRKAEKLGLYKRTESPVRGWSQTITHYWVEFDIVGVFLLVAGFVLFLLPFSLATSVAGQWKSASIISMLVIGFVILCLFPIWERFGASKPFLPWERLKDRTVFGAVLCISSLYAAFYCWNLYYYTFNQVSWDEVSQLNYKLTIPNRLFSASTLVMLHIWARSTPWALVSLVSSQGKISSSILLRQAANDCQNPRQMDQTLQVDCPSFSPALHDGHWVDDLLQTARSCTQIRRLCSNFRRICWRDASSMPPSRSSGCRYTRRLCDYPRPPVPCLICWRCNW
jgi:MFS family permease